MHIKNNHRVHLFNCLGNHLAALAPKIDSDETMKVDIFVGDDEIPYYHCSDKTGNCCTKVYAIKDGAVYYIHATYSDDRPGVAPRYVRQQYALTNRTPKLVDDVCDNIARFILAYIGRNEIIGQQLNGPFEWDSNEQVPTPTLRRMRFNVKPLPVLSK